MRNKQGVEIGMLRRSLACAVLAAVSLTSPARAEPRAVIELFTSQGCSSCPAADRLLGELAADPSLIAISLSMDVWDYLGWKDTLADPRNTARWQAYSKSRGDGQRYTPQAVVNGAAHALGSDRGAIEKAIEKSRRNRSTLDVPMKASLGNNGREVRVDISDGDAGAGAMMWLVGLSKAVTVAIKRGENKGKTVTYHNVVRSWRKLDTWNGKARHWSFMPEPSPRKDIDSVAILVQAGTADMPGVMLGAAVVALR